MSAARLVALAALAVEVLAGGFAYLLFMAFPFCAAALVALAVMVCAAAVVVLFA